MELIENNNCQDLCDNAYCSEKYTHFEKVFINGMEIIITLCKEHAEEFDNATLKAMREVEDVS